MSNIGLRSQLIWLTTFSIAMAFVESSVVVYLRAIFYPAGFAFPLKIGTYEKILVEAIREAATMVMLISVAYLAGQRLWERFACFMVCFGIWDIFYYVWLKVLLDWPSSLFEWDVLFLIPLPWIGPVIAPASIAVLMTVFGVLILRSVSLGKEFAPSRSSHLLAWAGFVIVLYSFMYDTEATLRQQMPEPYRYDLLIAGEILFTAAFFMSYFRKD